MWAGRFSNSKGNGMDFFPAGNVFHEYHGVKYAMPDWLPALLPDEDELPLPAWPTFCGAGDSFGDWIVRDRICGQSVKIPCFIHDIGWATSKGRRLSDAVRDRPAVRRSGGAIQDT